MCLWGFDDNVRRIFFHVFANSFSQKKQISKTNVMSCHNHYQNIEFWLWWSYLIILSFKGIILWILGNNFIGTIVVCIDNFGFGHFWCVLFIYLFGWIWKKWWWLVVVVVIDVCGWWSRIFSWRSNCERQEKMKENIWWIEEINRQASKPKRTDVIFQMQIRWIFLVKEFTNKNFGKWFFLLKKKKFSNVNKTMTNKRMMMMMVKMVMEKKKKKRIESNETSGNRQWTMQCFFFFAFFLCTYRPILATINGKSMNFWSAKNKKKMYWLF